MSKIRLDLDTLRVDSFETAAAEKTGRGTVAAYRAAEPSGVSCIAYSCGVGYCEPDTSLKPVEPEPGGDTLIC